MPTETLAVSAESTPNNWTLGAGASKVSAVTAPNDDNTSFIASGTSNNTQQQFAFHPPTTIQVGDTVTSVQFLGRCVRGGTQNVNFVMTAVVLANSAAGTGQTATASYADFTDTFATAPDGTAWKLSDLNDLQIRIQNSQARDLRCTTLEAVVTYTEATRYNLTTPERQIVTSWLYEAGGYLDVAVDDAGVSARQALAADAGLDVTGWIRTHTKGATVGEEDWVACGMVWWIRANDGVTVLPANRPPETASWITILNAWAASINAGLLAVSEVARNGQTVPITDVSGNVTTMPAGTQLVHQRSMITSVLGVLS